jgi:hypothetical protein
MAKRSSGKPEGGTLHPTPSLAEETPAIGEPDPDPWYHFTDWWEGLSSAQVAARVVEACREAGHGGWVVVPAWYPNPRWAAPPPPVLGPSSDDLMEALRGSCAFADERYVDPDSTEARAWSIYTELTKRSGYSPTHAGNAWAGARAFEAGGVAPEKEDSSGD